jgi:hypothetical protein
MLSSAWRRSSPNNTADEAEGYGLKLIIGSGNRLGLERLAGTIGFGRDVHASGEGRRQAG